MMAATSITFRTDAEIKRRAASILNKEPSTEYSEWMKQELQKSWKTRKYPNRKRYSTDEVWNKLGLDT